MGQGEGFKHITVTAAEDEDVVIRVGATSRESREDVEGGSEARRAPEATAVATVVAAGAAGAPAAADVPPAPEAAPAPDTSADADSGAGAEPPRKRAETPRGRQRAQGAKKADDYRETTLEDLEPAPMPLAQKVTVVAAVLCIIGAIVYWAVFLG